MKRHIEVMRQDEMPYIGLHGEWLAEAGFTSGSHVQINVDYNRLTITKAQKSSKNDLENIIDGKKDLAGFAGDYRGQTVRLVLERYSSYRPIKLESTQDTYRFLKPLQYESREVALSIALDPAYKVLSVYEVSKGSAHSTNFSAYEVIKSTLAVNSTHIILAHNHPNGLAKPSLEDLNTTGMLMQAAKLVQIEVLDHIIVGFNDYTSLREMGFIEK